MSKVEVMHVDSYLGYAIAASVISVSTIKKCKNKVQLWYWLLHFLGHSAVGVVGNEEKVGFGD
jgi:hypothetical protein